MGTASSLHVVEISVCGYLKKYLLITKSQLYKEVGELVVSYLSTIEPYETKQTFIDSLYDQLAELVSVDDGNTRVSFPQENFKSSGIDLSILVPTFSYKEREKYMTKYIHDVIIFQCVERGEMIELDEFSSINIFPIEDRTMIKI